MAFFNSAVNVLQTLVITLGAGLGVWGVINLLEGYTTATTTPAQMLMYGKEVSNRKQEIDRQHHTIPNQRSQRPKDKHRGNMYNLLFRHGKVRSQNMEKLKCSFPTFCKQTFPQLHKTASYAHYTQCRLLRNPSHSFFVLNFLIVYITLCNML